MNMICYDCNPASQGSCTDPVRDNATEVYCPRLADMLSYCFSVYVDANTATNSGIYRGCMIKYENDDNECDYLTLALSTTGNVTWCETCVEDDCNVDQYQNA
jgi:hypothetical protein